MAGHCLEHLGRLARTDRSRGMRSERSSSVVIIIRVDLLPFNAQGSRARAALPTGIHFMRGCLMICPRPPILEVLVLGDGGPLLLRRILTASLRFECNEVYHEGDAGRILNLPPTSAAVEPDLPEGGVASRHGTGGPVVRLPRFPGDKTTGIDHVIWARNHP